MKYKIAIHESEEGYSVSVPGLPGCWSQGDSEQEALDNILEAIREYLTVVEEQLRGEGVREVEITVWRLPRIAGVNHLDAVRAFEKAGFRIARQGKHVVLTNGQTISPFLVTTRSMPSPWAVLVTPGSRTSNSASCSRCQQPNKALHRSAPIVAPDELSRWASILGG